MIRTSRIEVLTLFRQDPMEMLKKACPESGRRAASGVPGFAGAARQTWGRPFAAFGLTDLPLFAAFALTYAAYAPRVKRAAAFPSTPRGTGLDEPFGRHRIFRIFPFPDMSQPSWRIDGSWA